MNYELRIVNGFNCPVFYFVGQVQLVFIVVGQVHCPVLSWSGRFNCPYVWVQQAKAPYRLLQVGCRGFFVAFIDIGRKKSPIPCKLGDCGGFLWFYRYREKSPDSHLGCDSPSAMRITNSPSLGGL